MNLTPEMVAEIDQAKREFVDSVKALQPNADECQIQQLAELVGYASLSIILSTIGRCQNSLAVDFEPRYRRVEELEREVETLRAVVNIVAGEVDKAFQDCGDRKAILGDYCKPGENKFEAISRLASDYLMLQQRLSLVTERREALEREVETRKQDVTDCIQLLVSGEVREKYKSVVAMQIGLKNGEVNELKRKLNEIKQRCHDWQALGKVSPDAILDIIGELS